MTLTCLCGQARVETAKTPDYLNACNCTLCSKSGAVWAYYDPAEIAVSGTTIGYSRADKDDPGAEIRFCPTCGATTHFVLTESAVAKFGGNTVAGVNMRLADEGELAGVELRYPDGRGWSGAGAFTYVREARIIGQSD